MRIHYCCGSIRCIQTIAVAVVTLMITVMADIIIISSSSSMIMVVVTPHDQNHGIGHINDQRQEDI